MKEERSFPKGAGGRNASRGLEVPELPLNMCQVPREVGRQICSWPTPEDLVLVV